MDETSTSNLEEIGTAAHLMMEAVDKASHELERTVTSSHEYLQSFSQTLGKNFIQHLAKLSEEAQRTANKNSEEMQARKEDFAERLIELEHTEINSLMQASKEVRHELNLSLQKTIDEISQLIEKQVETLQPLVQTQHESLTTISKTECAAIQKLMAESKNALSGNESILKKDLANQVKEFEQMLRTVLDTNQEKLLAKIKSDKERLTEQAKSAQTELSQFIISGKKGLDENTRVNDGLLSSSVDNLNKSLVAQIDEWQLTMENFIGDFGSLLDKDKNSFDQVHKTKIERQVGEVKEEIRTIARDAEGQLSASHKLFDRSLQRLERKYHERLEKLLSQFEAALAQENKLLAGFRSSQSEQSFQPSQELKELMNTRLKARGLEIVKTFKRQVELFDLEHARFAASCKERVETADETARDFLEQQLKTMNSDVERVLRSFRVELSQLQLQLPQIKDAGHAAALAVMAYKRARLTI